MKKKYTSNFLFAMPSFLLGVGSVLNVSGNYYTFNYSKSDSEADTRAIESDWGMVGEDIKFGLQKTEHEINGNKN